MKTESDHTAENTVCTLICYTVGWERMRALQSKVGAFQKVGECLYRYSSNGVYYARIRVDGKEIKRSLETTDRAIANRELARFKNEQRQIDRSQGKLTLAQLCDRYVKTVQHQKPRTIERKTCIVGRIKREWPTGSKLTQIAKIKPSDVDLWLVSVSRRANRFGSASRNLHISCIKEVLALAVRDRIIPASPATHLRSAKREKPIRLTPTFEQFKAIIADVRAQVFNADAQDSADFLEFLGLAGLGQAEAGSLTRSDVDLEAGRIITFRHKTSTGFAIPIFPQVRSLLERLCKGKSNGHRLFRISDAKKALAGACRRLQMPPFSPRSFRRMFITRAIELGVDVKVIAEWQGHRDGGKLILDTYSHVNRVHSQRMAQLITEGQPTNVVTFDRGEATFDTNRAH
jgi:integrase